MSWYEIPVFIVNTLILIYAAALSISYIVLAYFSVKALRHYIKRNFFVDYNSILASPYAPSISLIAPAYNESFTIIDNVRSLLSLHYSNFDVIIVNDGSKDDSLQKTIDYYELVKVNFAVEYKIRTKEVRGVYKSKNPAYKKLIVIDKVNGGKADALNVGLNISDKSLVACIDVDCIIEQDALLKMVKPFLEESTQVIATGGVVRIANSCVVEDGRLIKVNLPENMLARFQVLEYLRAFLLGRMAWSRLNCLLLISGAFGLFDKKIAIAAGGYNHNTVGEDMELIVRMRIYMADLKKAYKVVYIPDPLCWTEAPITRNILGRQRNRWFRGTAETLSIHRKLFFNRKYGLLGLISYPYWFFFEYLAPFIEVVGLSYFLFLVILSKVNWLLFLLLLSAVYFFALMLSTFAILSEEYSYYQYTSKKDTFKLLATAMIEPFVFHPFIVISSIKGFIDLKKGTKSWGEMTRTGFSPKKRP